MSPTIWTVGHSNRSIDEFIGLLRSCGIATLADIRRFPGSRRLPQFGTPVLQDALAAGDIAYVWLPSLGGRRKARPDSDNTAWRNLSFRGYADHMETEEFAEGLMDLASLACATPTAMMCSEAVWWRCHRSLVADALEVMGFSVLHILALGNVVPHPMTSPAKVEDGVLSYASDEPVQSAFDLA